MILYFFVGLWASLLHVIGGGECEMFKMILCGVMLEWEEEIEMREKQYVSTDLFILSVKVLCEH